MSDDSDKLAHIGDTDDKQRDCPVCKNNEELIAARERLLTLDQEKSEFVSIAAHQLRTPISAIRWSQQMLLDEEFGTLSDQQRNLLLQSQQSVARMAALVNDLLDADHLEHGSTRYHFKRVNIQKLVHDVVDELRPMADEKDVAIFVLDDPTPLVADGDAEQLKEAFLNLLNNAIKYTPIYGKVIVTLSHDSSSIRISFKDSGIGISESDQRMLFHKFFRSNNAKRIQADGTGLGLFIVKKIIDAHKGSISIESKENEGSNFIITVPYHTV